MPKNSENSVSTEPMHEPVLLKEVLEILNPKPGQVHIDGTVNGGGHARAIAGMVGSRGMVLGIDWDCNLVRELKKRNEESGVQNIMVECGNYADLDEIAKKNNIMKADGILLDLGFSSYHVDRSGRGFSFQKDEPLDMRYHISDDMRDAHAIVNSESEEALEDMVRTYGEERFARRIASGIVRARERKPIKTTRELAEIIRRASPEQYRSGRIHPATRTFQALRIVVNHELENLRSGLRNAMSLLSPGGTAAVISFHSLEDRIVKNFFKEFARQGTGTITTLKPVRASLVEMRQNPRARSARLRAIRKFI